MFDEPVNLRLWIRPKKTIGCGPTHGHRMSYKDLGLDLKGCHTHVRPEELDQGEISVGMICPLEKKH